MKSKIFFALVVTAVTGVANAAPAAPASITISGTNAAVCRGLAGNGDITSDQSGYVQVSFKQGCSQNVWMNVAQNNSQAWAVSGSSKGKFYMIGNSNGGAPRATTTAIPSSGDPAPSDTDMTAAQALGSS